MTHRPSLKTLYIIYAALVVLWIATFLAAEIDVPPPWHVVIALSIAVTKMLLIMLFFMHLLYTAPLVRLVAFSGFFWLLILVGLSFTDFLSRGWLPWSEVVGGPK